MWYPSVTIGGVGLHWGKRFSFADNLRVLQIVAQLLSFPIGRAWVRYVPRVIIFGIPLNPGPFTIKKHVCPFSYIPAPLLVNCPFSGPHYYYGIVRAILGLFGNPRLIIPLRSLQRRRFLGCVPCSILLNFKRDQLNSCVAYAVNQLQSTPLF